MARESLLMPSAAYLRGATSESIIVVRRMSEHYYILLINTETVSMRYSEGMNRITYL